MEPKHALSRISRRYLPGVFSSVRDSKRIAKLVPELLCNPQFPEYFRNWERCGFHITPKHFYSPIPDTQSLPPQIWEQPSELAGIDMNPEGQLHLLQDVFPFYRDEFIQFPSSPTSEPTEFYLNNNSFDGLDALVLYCMVRHFRPGRVIECGSGFSTLVTATAARQNGNTTITCVEPYPSPRLENAVKDIKSISLVQSKAEDLPISFFQDLREGDILFIDTSHVVRIGGDVTFLFLEVIPRLAPGVVIHVHDVFFPWEYPKDWIYNELRFWNEQYLLQAFLAFNSCFRVLFANYFMEHFHRTLLRSIFSNASCAGSSFWMQRD